jgi:hypothetical protein
MTEFDLKQLEERAKRGKPGAVDELVGELRKLRELLKKVPQFDCHPSEMRHSDLCKEIRTALGYAIDPKTGAMILG